MINEIKYGGFVNNPSDYECPDGDLAASVNLLNEDGSLKPLCSPIAIRDFGLKYSPVAIHTVNRSLKIIILLRRGDNSLCYVPFSSSEAPSLLMKLNEDETFKGVNPFGNTLVISSSRSLYYIIWDSQASAYRVLGSAVPDINVDFALRSSIAMANVGRDLSLVDSDKVQSKDWNRLSLTEFTDQPFTADNIGGFYPATTPIINVSTDVKIEKGKEYKFLLHTDIRVSTDTYYLTLNVYGEPELTATVSTPADLESNRTLIAQSSKKSGSHEIPISIVADKNYENLSFSISIRSKSNMYYGDFDVSGRLEVMLGADHIIADSKIIDYTSDAFTTVSAAVNKFIADNGVADNKFIYPFFARYAVRLFDGSYSRVSPPVLLIPNSGYAPTIYFRQEVPQLSLRAFSAELCMRIMPPQSLSDWKGIIAGVDIFISSPVYSYNMGLEYDADEQRFFYSPVESLSSWGEGRVSHEGIELTGGLYHAHNSLKDLSSRIFDSASYQASVLSLSPFDEKELKSNVESASSFYKIASIDFEHIPEYSELNPIEMPDGALKSLASKPSLTDRYLPYASFTSASMFSYNSRLCLFDASYRLPQPPSFSRCQPFANASVGTFVEHISVFLHTLDGDKCVVCEYPDMSTSFSRKAAWFFYPDNRAFRAVVSFGLVLEDNSILFMRHYDMKLTEHPFINGAYFYTDDPSTVESDSDPLTTPPVDDSHVAAPGTVYISDPANPFVFDSALVVSDLPHVLALSSATQALSQGQFGQFPIYAFTAEGVWALEISDEGTCISHRPVSRDVCSCPEAVTQIDSAVIFPTSRGIMLISGSSLDCISDAIDSEFPLSPDSFPHLVQLANSIGLTSIFPMPLRNFLSNCRIIYDYPHSRIVIYRPSESIALVCSFKSHLWATATLPIVENLNSYPDALAVNTKGYLIDFSAQSNSPLRGLVLSRPLKLSGPDVLKTVDAIIQRGNFRRGHVQSVVYGSRDLYNWSLVWSSKDHYLRGFHGTPYKYFRVALLCDLGRDESIVGASVQFDSRKTNQLR